MDTFAKYMSRRRGTRRLEKGKKKWSVAMLHFSYIMYLQVYKIIESRL